MKSLLRISTDDSGYVVDYRVRVGYYRGQVHTRRFARFDSFLAFVIQYLFNLNSD